MAEFTITLTANNDTRPVFQVIVNDGGSDGGSFATLLVGGFPPTMDYVAADTAVQAFAAAYVEAAGPGHTVVAVTRLTVAETVL